MLSIKKLVKILQRGSCVLLSPMCVAARPDIKMPCQGILENENGHALENLPGVDWLCCRCPDGSAPLTPCSKLDPASRVCHSNNLSYSVIFGVGGGLAVVLMLVCWLVIRSRRSRSRNNPCCRKVSQKSVERIDLLPLSSSASDVSVTVPKLPYSTRVTGDSAGTSGYASDCERSAVESLLAQRPRDRIISRVVGHPRTLSVSISAPDLQMV